jgi:predicted nuclease of predicted toxin-antitoxin system
MKFLVDAQLPRRLARKLQEFGYDALHTLDLPKGNCTTDTEINDMSIQEHRVVITKDADFVNSFIAQHKPYKLLLVSTGNIKNSELEALFLGKIQQIEDYFATHDYIEIDLSNLIVHI